MSGYDLAWLMEHGGNVMDDDKPSATAAISRTECKRLLAFARGRRKMQAAHEGTGNCHKGCVFCE